ncbi:MAG: uridine phosphorylase [Actinomycetota bacterium]
MGSLHLGLEAEDLDGATLALLPGDPGRVPRIAENFDRPRHLVSAREYVSWLGYVNDQAVLLGSTGIGGPSLSIAVEELAQIGIRTFLRVGTTGAIQPEMAPGEVVISTGAVRLDGASRHFAPIEFPAVADFGVVGALIESAVANGIAFHLGVTASSDTFYPGQARDGTFTGFLLPELRGSLETWRRLGVLSFEMEAATLFTMCSVMGLRAGAVCGVVVNRSEREDFDDAAVRVGEEGAIAVAVSAASLLTSI